MTHKENIQEILKGCDLCKAIECSCPSCVGILKGYLKAVNVEVEQTETKRLGIRMIDCEEAIELGEKA